LQIKRKKREYCPAINILVNLDPAIVSEIKKAGPCVVISPDEMNKYVRTIVVAPMTVSSKNIRPRYWIILDQIRTIDRQRIVKIFENLKDSEIQKLKSVIKETYVTVAIC